jgi:hypothetical protein
MDMTIWLLLALPCLFFIGQLINRRSLVTLLGYASTVLSRLAIFNAIPIFSLAGALLAWARVRRSPSSKAARGVVFALLFGGFTSLLATLWSVDGLDAIATSLRWLALAPLVLVMLNVVWEDRVDGVLRILVWLSPVVIAQGVTTIFFRFSPMSEDAYYQSGLARFFLGEAAQALFTDEGWNNVREIDRAGGFLFVSVNRAALVMGVMFMMYLGMWLYTRKLFPLLVSILLATAIISGGSKTGLVLLFVMPAFALTAAAVSRRRNPATRMIILLVALFLSAVALQVFVSTADDFITASEVTLIPRYTLWGEAIRAIVENPLGGLGFGGWEQRWFDGQVAADFNYRPAHDWLLQAWLDGGVLYAAANVALVVAIVACMLRSLNQAQGSTQARLIALSGGAFLWSFIHGTLDNTPIFGDPPACVFLAIAAALMIAVGDRNFPLEPASNASAATARMGSRRATAVRRR